MLLPVLAFAQVTFVPGYLALSAFRVKRGSLVETLALSFSISLLLNYLAVFALTSAEAYTRSAVLALLGAEVVVAGVLLAKWLAARTPISISMTWPSLRQAFRWETAVVGSTAVVLAVYAMQTLRAMLRLNVFNYWDPIFSWNRWAMLWYGGAIPGDSKLYPQMIPANWSLMYHIMGTPEIQSAPLSVMPLFVIGVLALFFDLAVRRKRIEYLIAMVACAVALYAIRGQVSLASGHVDMAVAFTTMVAFYLVELRDDRRLGNWRELALPLTAAAAASVTKFNGLLALIVILALGAAGHFAARHTLSATDWLRSGALALGAIALVPGSWYGLKLLDILSGRDTTYYSALAQATSVEAGGGNLAARLLHAESLAPGSWPAVLLLGLVVAAAVPLARTRWVALGLFVPYTVLWALFLSYDVRNELMMVPVVSYLVAFVGAAWLLRRSNAGAELRVRTAHTLQVTPATLALAIGVGIVVLVAASAALPERVLESKNLALERTIGSAKLDGALYEVDSHDGGITGNLLTDYLYFDYLPGFRASLLRRDHTAAIHTIAHVSAEITEADLEGEDWLLLSDEVSPTVRSLVDERLRDGSYTLAFAQEVPLADNAYVHPTRVRLIHVNR